MRVVIFLRFFLCIELLFSLACTPLRLLPIELSIELRESHLGRFGCGMPWDWWFLFWSCHFFLQFVRPLHVGESLVVWTETEFLLLDFDEHAINCHLPWTRSAVFLRRWLRCRRRSPLGWRTCIGWLAYTGNWPWANRSAEDFALPTGQFLFPDFDFDWLLAG